MRDLEIENAELKAKTILENINNNDFKKSNNSSSNNSKNIFKDKSYNEKFEENNNSKGFGNRNNRTGEYNSSCGNMLKICMY